MIIEDVEAGRLITDEALEFSGCGSLGALYQFFDREDAQQTRDKQSFAWPSSALTASASVRFGSGRTRVERPREVDSRHPVSRRAGSGSCKNQALP
ncbi:hypothetical protein [Aureimonas jatrophae]|uniref:hypothetical protein n=1 Tax=Aureimonas jatrophae TaxID=1166073 RepID=UPI001113F902|nr:hypothetical protein [Aureimonas jatrophae]MBB3951913.1 hypothetical protein [Aureimonas jatrophae]